MRVLIVIFFLLIKGICFSQNDTLFDQGNKFYNEGKYAEAIDMYEAILETDKHSAELYFNLANSHYKLSNVGPSVYYYEKALQFKPNDKDILNNRAFANNMTIDDIAVIPEVGLSKFVRKASVIITFDAWSKLAVILVFVFVVLLLLYYFSNITREKRIYFISSFTALFLAFLSLGFAFHNFNLQRTNNPAIVFSKESQVRSEPNMRSNQIFIIHEGTKVQIINTVNNWKEIKLTDGKTGWVVNEDIKLLNDI